MLPNEAVELAVSAWGAVLVNKTDAYMHVMFPNLHEAANWAHRVGFEEIVRFRNSNLTLSRHQTVVLIVPNASAGDVRDAKDWLDVNDGAGKSHQKDADADVIGLVQDAYQNGWGGFLDDKGANPGLLLG